MCCHLHLPAPASSSPGPTTAGPHVLPPAPAGASEQLARSHHGWSSCAATRTCRRQQAARPVPPWLPPACRPAGDASKQPAAAAGAAAASHKGVPGGREGTRARAAESDREHSLTKVRPGMAGGAGHERTNEGGGGGRGLGGRQHPMLAPDRFASSKAHALHPFRQQLCIPSGSSSASLQAAALHPFRQHACPCPAPLALHTSPLPPPQKSPSPCAGG
jgi:hypothetical protein